MAKEGDESEVNSLELLVGQMLFATLKQETHYLFRI